jgi:hypothetical protein
MCALVSSPLTGSTPEYASFNDVLGTKLHETIRDDSASTRYSAVMVFDFILSLIISETASLAQCDVY